MAYERDDRGRPRGGIDPRSAQDRGFFERAGDEVRSWFGDEEAERRRRYDERYDERIDRDRYASTERGGYRGPEGGPSWYRSNRDEFRRGGEGGGNYGYPDDRAYEGRQFDDGGRGTGYAGDFGRDRGYERDYRAGGGRSQPGGYGSGDHGRDRTAGYADEWQRGYNREGSSRDAGSGASGSRGHDEHGYANWRDRQMSAFDRDYDEYRRENQSRFETEFATWRQNRQTQRDSLNQVKEHQEVVGSDGAHVGTVDHVRSDHILLTKTDKDAGGHHHAIPSSWVASVGEKVQLSRSADEAKRAWRDTEERGAAFGGGGGGGGREQERQAGAGQLNRSFSGTY